MAAFDVCQRHTATVLWIEGGGTYGPNFLAVGLDRGLCIQALVQVDMDLDQLFLDFAEHVESSDGLLT